MNCSEITTLAPLYLSGELEESRAAEFTRHLEGCSDCVGRLEQQMEQHGEMDARMREMDVRVREMVPDHPDTAALERRIRSRIAAAARAQRIRRWSIAAGVLLAVLGLRVFLMNRVPRVCADAAEDHRGEVIGKERRNWIADPAALSVLARRVGLESLDAQALAPSGYRFEHGKLCRLDGRVFVHLVYASGSAEVSVFLRSREAGASEARPQAASLRGEHVASIQTNRLTAVAVTTEPGDAALLLAESVSGAL